jgi:hypothetical protein
MSCELEGVTVLLGSHLQGQQANQQICVPKMASKRMKLSHKSLPTVTSDFVIKPDQFGEGKTMVDNTMSIPSISKPVQRCFRNESMGSTNLFTSQEEEYMMLTFELGY